GGSHLQALARIGISRFHVADLDTFELANFNRQIGATMETIGRSKTEVAAAMVHNINPEAEVARFNEGIGPETMDEFLNGLNCVVDGLEFFAMEVRRSLYRACRSRGIPVINAGPIGFGASLVVFTGDSISFDDFFRLDDSLTKTEQLLAFGLGLNPNLNSHVAPEAVDMRNQKGPALCSACFLCSALAAQEAVKLTIGRGRVAVAPHGKYFDLMTHRVSRLKRRPHLRRSLFGRLIRALAFRRMPQVKALYLEELQVMEMAQQRTVVAVPAPRKEVHSC
ncbi:MAG TPA: ThiF family adenylyltransferase, partial [Planctomycetota bacterium]|nr:ThiF family adenylyltransferase [Planctomycetota bacterium]